MNKTLFLSKVIRRVKGNLKPKPNTEELVIINKSTGKAKDRKPLLGGNFAFYLVSNNNDPMNTAENEIDYKVEDFDVEVELSVAYRISCNQGSEKKMAEALHNEGSLESEMNKRVLKWIKRFIENKGDTVGFINEFYAQKRKLTDFVKTNVQNELGVCINLKIALKQEKQLRPFPIPSIEFTVFVKDCNDELRLCLGTELLVDESNKVKAVLNYGRELLLVNTVKEEVKDYFVQNITLHRFCYELKSSVRSELMAHLNKTLHRYGRQLKHLSLDSDSVSPGDELLDNSSYDVECRVEGYQQPILVKNTLYMKPKDMGKYRLANSPNLEKWAQEKLKSIVQPLLLKEEYINAMETFSSISEKIKNQMDKAADEIGYQIAQLVSQPDFKPIELLKNFDLEAKGDFLTKDARVNVKLRISVTARITNLRDIKDYLYQQVDVKGLMKSSIYNAARRYLTQAEPERFYMRFYHYEIHLGEKQSVEQELTDKIKQELEERFSAQVSVVVPTPLDTEITECYQKLHSKIGFFRFEIESLKGGESIPYRGDFQIEAVEKDSWYIFQSRKPSLDDIRESIERSLKAILPTIESGDLQYVDFDDRQDIQDFINQKAKENIVGQFGLEISLSNFNRERTNKEQIHADALKELEGEEVQESLARIKARIEQRANELKISSTKNQTLFNELKRLYDLRLKLSGDEENEDERNYLNEQIAILEKELLNPSLEDARSNLDRLEPKKKKGKSFREIRQESLSESDRKQTLGPAENEDESDENEDET